MHSAIKTDVWRSVTLALVLAALIVVSNGRVTAQTPDAPKPKTDAEKLQERLKLLEDTVVERGLT